jgi:broad specificity phosphatase PhoE
MPESNFDPSVRERTTPGLSIPMPYGLRFASRGVQRSFVGLALMAGVAGVSEGTLAARTWRPATPTAPGQRAPTVAAATVVLVMRHAERAADGSPDPSLTGAGMVRARALAAAVTHGGVQAVFATQLRRTRETAEPLARAAGVPVTERSIGATNASTYALELAHEIRDRHAGQTVAVVGHSNTVPALVAALSGGAAPAVGENDYGDVFVVVLGDSAPTRVLRLRVGS